MPQAEFELEFVTPPGVAALANAREAGEPVAAPGGLIRHTYERTPAMSTYLVAVGLHPLPWSPCGYSCALSDERAAA